MWGGTESGLGLNGDYNSYTRDMAKLAELARADMSCCVEDI